MSIETTALRLFAVLEEFRRLEPNLPVQVIQFFLSAAHRPGRSVLEIGRAAGLGKSSAQRAYQALADRHWRKDGKPMQLLTAVPNPGDARYLAIHLSANGRALLSRVENALGGAEHNARS